MEMLKKLFASAFIYALVLRVLVQESQSGFINIDCGTQENSGYYDEDTGLYYTSDATLAGTGVGNNISSEYKSTALEKQFLNVRSFPEGKRNCYTLEIAPGDIKFFIRARFMYGNYDGKGKVPSFNLILGADVWDSVELADASTIVTKEIIHIPQSNYVYVCLENIGFGTPFISVLELRPLSNSTYYTQSGSLLLYRRLDVGSTTNQTFRGCQISHGMTLCKLKSVPWKLTILGHSFSSSWQGTHRLQMGLKVKYRSDGTLERYKARLVAKGYNQRQA
ncbi:putative leucine-rich repeat receptor-like serine/threonine-protein kinase At2g19230 [Pistacia vera]|uniref:putative leucine-rich repeat receptor-like serine/threonine-protein kinase At2g19230 n=1 Tax=Pistacia vera TaxID=55513 RepID=UPI001263A6AA|nr:putative leucine-rich repeat receptor-like serine/threonine-protein kinase At2g19230 [Pistacia vera]